MQESGASKILLYFVLMGIFVPSFEKIHYFFLLKYASMTQETYDLLSVFPHIGMAIGAAIYMGYL